MRRLHVLRAEARVAPHDDDDGDVDLGEDVGAHGAHGQEAHEGDDQAQGRDGVGPAEGKLWTIHMALASALPSRAHASDPKLQGARSVCSLDGPAHRSLLACSFSGWAALGGTRAATDEIRRGPSASYGNPPESVRLACPPAWAVANCHTGSFPPTGRPRRPAVFSPGGGLPSHRRGQPPVLAALQRIARDAFGLVLRGRRERLCQKDPRLAKAGRPGDRGLPYRRGGDSRRWTRTVPTSERTWERGGASKARPFAARSTASASTRAAPAPRPRTASRRGKRAPAPIQSSSFTAWRSSTSTLASSIPPGSPRRWTWTAGPPFGSIPGRCAVTRRRRARTRSTSVTSGSFTGTGRSTSSRRSSSPARTSSLGTASSAHSFACGVARSRRARPSTFTSGGSAIPGSRSRTLTAGLDLRLLVLPTPLDADHIELRIGLSVRDFRASPRVPGALRWLPRFVTDGLLGRALLRVGRHEVQQDFAIWKHKRYIGAPQLASGEGPVGL